MKDINSVRNTAKVCDRWFPGEFQNKPGDVVTYKIDHGFFVAGGVRFGANKFFTMFEDIQGEAVMDRQTFEYILCNSVFPQAVLFPENYSRIYSLVIQKCCREVIMITCDEDTGEVRVSYPDKQETYESYLKAFCAIRTWQDENKGY